jgi:xanthine dehydrogenase accessory factor
MIALHWGGGGNRLADREGPIHIGAAAPEPTAARS